MYWQIHQYPVIVNALVMLLEKVLQMEPCSFRNDLMLQMNRDRVEARFVLKVVEF